MHTIPTNALSAALKNQLCTARNRMIAAEHDPALEKDGWHDTVQRLAEEVRNIEYAVKLAELHEAAFTKLVECLETIRQLDTSPIPEGPVNGQPVPKGMSRFKTPKESAEHVLYELRHMGLIEVKP